VLRELLDQHWVAPTTGESEPGEPDKELDEERIRSLGPLVVSSDPSSTYWSTELGELGWN
jgi:hypothetical protein